MTDTKNTVDKQTLKSTSGEFDIESIHTLSLQGKSLDDVGCLGECTSLERLVLRENRLSALHGLASLTSLVHLDLTDNRIALLDGIQTLNNLQTVLLAGNLIRSIDALRCLSTLENLTELRLHDAIRNLSNPVCAIATYQEELTRILPRIVFLDGEKLQGQGSEFYKACARLDSLLAEHESSWKVSESTNNIERLIPAGFWDHSPEAALKEADLTETEEKLEEMLEEFKTAQDAADENVQAALKSIQEAPSLLICNSSDSGK